MSTTEKLPKWASILLMLLIGMAFSFGGQLFIASANKSSSDAKSCVLDKGAPGNADVKIKSGNLSGGNAKDKALKKALDADKAVHLVCSK